MTLFYIHGATTDLQFLPNDESKHAVKVLRLQSGNLLSITNGTGDIFTAKVIMPNQKKCEIHIFEHEHFKRKAHSIHMVIAPTKLNDRYEWMLEKMTEMGVDEITPIICQHSERKFLKLDRMERIIVSAVKQSWKAYKPVINEPVKYSDFIKKNTFQHQFIAHCNGGCGSEVHLKTMAHPNSEIAVLIGPEGDFSEKEVKLATENNWLKTGLGSARLRTETAALVACFTLNLMNE
ncbi:MAG: 16S rRNA (uracil1498-N3)-methyltransferase [Salibacteraceae bacterium]|jgi:16S rRNA (uracil1498-N3)-methyltransferase